jgi:hypothetical protein
VTSILLWLGKEVNQRFRSLPLVHRPTPSRCEQGHPGPKKSRPACDSSSAAPFQAGTPYSLGCGQYHRCEELNYRVRNGNGCFLSTLGTRNFKVSCPEARGTILLEFQRYCLARHCRPCRLFTLFMNATPCKPELAGSFPTSRRMPGLHGNESGQANR